MEYRVELTARAERDLVLLYIEKDAAESASAARWYNELRTAMQSLAYAPLRCPKAPESSPKRELRHLLYGKRPHVYRVIYEVEERRQSVKVLHIRHDARKPLRLL